MIIPKPDENSVRWYGQWAGNRKGRPEDTACCIAEVHNSVTFLFRQCGRKRGHGRDGLFCKQHAKMAEQETRR